MSTQHQVPSPTRTTYFPRAGEGRNTVPGDHISARPLVHIYVSSQEHSAALVQFPIGNRTLHSFG